MRPAAFLALCCTILNCVVAAYLVVRILILTPFLMQPMPVVPDTIVLPGLCLGECDDALGWASFALWVGTFALSNFDVVAKMVTKQELLSEVEMTSLLEEAGLDGLEIESKFSGSENELVIGEPTAAAAGIVKFMKVPADLVHQAISQGDGGVAAMEAEFEQLAHTGGGHVASAPALECFRYVLYSKTGDHREAFQNGVLDEGRPDGLGIDHFVDHRHSKLGGLSKAHVVALRVYTTAAYRVINEPLRSLQNGELTTPHPLPVTVYLISDAIKLLRQVGGRSSTANEKQALWRGLRNMRLPGSFMERGGSEMAPLSTTSDIRVAVRYSTSASSLLFKLATRDFMQRGADLQYLSAFPGEAEVLYPPLTYLRATGRTAEVVKKGSNLCFKIVEMVPTFPS